MAEGIEGMLNQGAKILKSVTGVRREADKQKLDALKNGGYTPSGSTRTTQTTFERDEKGRPQQITTTQEEYGDAVPYDRLNPAGRRGINDPGSYSLNTPARPNDVAINGQISSAEAARALRGMSNDERVALADNLQKTTGIQIFSRTGGVRIPELAAAVTEYARGHYNDISALENGNRSAWRQLEKDIAQDARGGGRLSERPAPSHNNNVPLERRVPAGGTATVPTEVPQPQDTQPVAQPLKDLPAADPELQAKIDALFAARIAAKKLSPEKESAMKQDLSNQMAAALNVSGYKVTPPYSNDEFAAWVGTKSELANAIKAGTPEAAGKALDSAVLMLQQEAKDSKGASVQQGQAPSAADIAAKAAAAKELELKAFEKNVGAAFEEMKTNTGKYGGHNPLRYVDNIKRALGMSDTSNDVTPEFIHKFSQVLYEHGGEQAVKSINNAAGFNLREVADRTIDRYRDAQKEAALHPKIEPMQSLAAPASAIAQQVNTMGREVFINGKNFALGSPECSEELKKMQMQSHQNGKDRLVKEEAACAAYAAAHAQREAASAGKPQTDAAKTTAQPLNAPATEYSIMKGVTLPAAMTSAPASVPTIPTVPAAPTATRTAPAPLAVDPATKQLADQLVGKFNALEKNPDIAGMLSPKVKAELMKDAITSLNTLGTPTTPENVFKNVAEWAAKNNPTKAKEMLALVPDPNNSVAVMSAIPALKPILEQLGKQMQAQIQAKEAALPSVKGGQSPTTVAPSFGGVKPQPQGAPALGQ
jgi:hypothetical protein